MKKSKNFVISLSLVAILLFCLIAPFALNVKGAQANTLTINNYTGNIYYFFDYYPTVSPSIMINKYSSATVTYDRKHIDSSDFDSLVGNDYFDSISHAYVIIDIKTFKPDPSTLEALFSTLYDNGCRTMFINLYESTAYSDTQFLNYLDEFLVTDFYLLERFTRTLLRDEYDANGGTLANTAFFIDGNLVDLSAFEELDLNVLCQDSIFLRIFFEELYDRLYQDMPIGILTIENFVDYLTSQNISILVHDMVANRYVNIYTGAVYSGTNIENLSPVVGDVLFYATNLCSVSFWALHNDFYDFLHASINANPTFTNYVLEAEPITYAAGGLPIDERTCATLDGIVQEIFAIIDNWNEGN